MLFKPFIYPSMFHHFAGAEAVTLSARAHTQTHTHTYVYETGLLLFSVFLARPACLLLICSGTGWAVSQVNPEWTKCYRQSGNTSKLCCDCEKDRSAAVTRQPRTGQWHSCRPIFAHSSSQQCPKSVRQSVKGLPYSQMFRSSGLFSRWAIPEASSSSD